MERGLRVCLNITILYLESQSLPDYWFHGDTSATVGWFFSCSVRIDNLSYSHLPHQGLCTIPHVLSPRGIAPVGHVTRRLPVTNAEGDPVLVVPLSASLTVPSLTAWRATHSRRKHKNYILRWVIPSCAGQHSSNSSLKTLLECGNNSLAPRIHACVIHYATLPQPSARSLSVAKL